MPSSGPNRLFEQTEQGSGPGGDCSFRQHPVTQHVEKYASKFPVLFDLDRIEPALREQPVSKGWRIPTVVLWIRVDSDHEGCREEQVGSRAHHPGDLADDAPRIVNMFERLGADCGVEGSLAKGICAASARTWGDFADERLTLNVRSRNRSISKVPRRSLRLPPTSTAIKSPGQSPTLLVR